MKAILVYALISAAAGPVFAAPPELGLPIDCEVGKTCWVQQYADHDASTGVQDYACGSETYDGHDGTDIRIRDMLARADVIASAAGVVSAARDGVPDRLVRSEADRAAIQDRECGNGVLINHGDGWETQYCHLRQGSLAVRAGDRVTGGVKLGEVGYSGMAAFPHVHLSVRKDGKWIDPFNSTAGACGQANNPLWTDDALAILAYRPGDIIGFGFSPGAADLAHLEGGKIANLRPTGDWPAIVAYLWAINLSDGDEVTVWLAGPEDISARNTVVLDRAKAQYLLFAGKKRPSGGWPSGDYVGRISIGSAGAVRLSREWRFSLQ